MKDKCNTLPKRVAYILANEPHAAVSDYELLAEVAAQFYTIEFERPPQDIREVVGILRHLPTLDQIARARRTATKKGLIENYRPTRVLESKGSNYPPEIQHKLETTGRTGIDD